MQSFEALKINKDKQGMGEGEMEHKLLIEKEVQINIVIH